jgi:hypothetical protein
MRRTLNLLKYTKRRWANIWLGLSTLKSKQWINLKLPKTKAAALHKKPKKLMMIKMKKLKS